MQTSETIHPSVLNLGEGLKKENAGEALRGVSKLPSENAVFAPVLFGKGLDEYFPQPGGSRSPCESHNSHTGK